MTLAYAVGLDQIRVRFDPKAWTRRRAEHAGYDPTALAKLGGHSLRAGFVTQGTRNGADGSAIARQTGHASLDSVEVYRREHAPLVGNAVNQIGL